MKCNPWRWLWGLLALLPLALFTITTARSPIEADLLARSTADLKRNGITWAELALTGRDVTLRGRAFADGDPEKAAQTILQTQGVRIVDNEAKLVDRIDNYTWQVARFGEQIRLSGHVPSEAARKEIIDRVHARFKGALVEDKMQLARGAPPRAVWMAGIDFALNQLAQLRGGEVDLDKTTVSVRGEAVSAASYRAVRTALASGLPQGIGLGRDGVRPPLVKPYTWAASLEKGGVSLQGYVPSEAVLADMRAAGRRAIQNGRLDDRVQLGDGAPAGFEVAMAALLDAMRSLDQADAQIRDRSVSISGLAATPALGTEARAAIRRIPPAFKVSEQIQQREPRRISPYVTTAVLADRGLALTGYVPSDEARQALKAFLQRGFPGHTLQDRMELASGQAPGWRRCLEAGLSALRRLGNGRVTLTDRALTVTGTADSEEMLNSLPGETRTAIGGDCTADIRLEESPRLIETRQRGGDRQRDADAERVRAAEAQRQAQAEVLRVQQQRAAEEEQRRAEAEAQRAAEEARRLAEAEQLKAQQQAREMEARRQSEAEARRVESERLLAEAARRLERQQEEARLKTEQARLDAEAAERHKGEQEAARAEAEARAEERARERQVTACQTLLSSTAREGVINFRYASDELDPKSFRTLNRLAKVTQNCANVHIEIQGHTDSDGTPERNQRLSDRRAKSVADYLIKAGAPADRLATIGYGETRPVAPNDTPKNKAKNRRIEFLVR